MSRIRLSLLAPFQPAKVLFPLPADVTQISHLKRHLLRSLSSIASVTSNAKELKLEIDGFELLSGASSDLIRENDVVCVTLAASSSSKTEARAVTSGSRKRRKSTVDLNASKTLAQVGQRAVSAPSGRPTKKPRISATPSVTLVPFKRSSRGASPATSVSSSSVSSSSSSASSSSNSSSSSDSSPDESTVPTSLPSRDVSTTAKVDPPFPVYSPASASQTSHVPPGHGKSSTQNRNQRRRMARRMKQMQAQDAVPVDVQASEISLDGPLASDSVTMEVESAFPAPKGLSNRNKRKGFKEDMAAIRPTRTVFGADAASGVEASFSTAAADVSNGEKNVEGDPLPFAGQPTATSQAKAKRRGGRAIPPSQQELPVNAFVTSQSFDQDQRRLQRIDEAQVEPGRAKQASQVDDNGADWQETPAEPSVDPVSGNDISRDWSTLLQQASTNFDALPPLTEDMLSSLRQNVVVAWRQLELNQWTFSPELVTHLGEVISAESGLTGVSVTIRTIMDPASFEGDHQGYEPEAEEAEDTFELNSAKVAANDGHWRLLKDTQVPAQR